MKKKILLKKEGERRVKEKMLKRRVIKVEDKVIELDVWTSEGLRELRDFWLPVRECMRCGKRMRSMMCKRCREELSVEIEQERERKEIEQERKRKELVEKIKRIEEWKGKKKWRIENQCLPVKIGGMIDLMNELEKTVENMRRFAKRKGLTEVIKGWIEAKEKEIKVERKLIGRRSVMLRRTRRFKYEQYW